MSLSRESLSVTLSIRATQHTNKRWKENENLKLDYPALWAG
jgi:hypothetical protein